MRTSNLVFGLLPVRRRFRCFCQDRSGSVAIMFALAVVTMIGAAGGVLDYSKAFNAREKMQYALDAAVLAAAADGNPGKVQNIAEREFKSNSEQGMLSGVTLSDTGTAIVVSATATVDVGTSFLGLFGIRAIPVKVTASATSPQVVRSVRFQAVDGQGWWEKTVRLMVVRAGSSTPVEIAKVHYDVSTKGPPPKGKVTASPDTWVDLGDYTKAYLEFTIGPKAYEFDKFCAGCPTVLRSDDPDTSDRFTIDDNAVPKGTVLDIFDFAKCGETSEQAWEDGGGGKPDIIYDIEASCGTSSGQSVRLIN